MARSKKKAPAGERTTATEAAAKKTAAKRSAKRKTAAKRTAAKGTAAKRTAAKGAPAAPGRTVDDVIADLRAFVPDGDDVGLCFELDRVFEGFREMTGRERAIPAIFDLLERGADADLGSLGPLVHELEALAG